MNWIHNPRILLREEISGMLIKTLMSWVNGNNNALYHPVLKESCHAVVQNRFSRKRQVLFRESSQCS
jgi:hypothetical protein